MTQIARALRGIFQIRIDIRRPHLGDLSQKGAVTLNFFQSPRVS